MPYADQTVARGNAWGSTTLSVPTVSTPTSSTVMATAATLRASGVSSVVVDCESGFVKLGLAQTLGAHLDDGALEDLAVSMGKLRAGLAEAGG